MRQFRNVKYILLPSAIAWVITATAGSAQGASITVDELGNGSFNGAPLTSGLLTDPFSGMTTLAYQLPFPGVPGDVQLIEPGVPQPNISDVVRFDGNFHLYFFSDNTDGPPFDPADVGLPPPSAALQSVVLLEVGPEGNNGAYWNPGFTGPGGNTAGADYFFVSDAVPEPTTLALVGLGGLLLTRRRRLQNVRVAR